MEIGFQSSEKIFASKRGTSQGSLDRGTLPSPLRYLSEHRLLKRKPRSEWAQITCPVHKSGQQLQEMNEKGTPRYPGAYMLNWAKNEPGEFYRLAARLIPTELQGTAPLTIQLIKFADLPDRDDIE